MPTGVAQTAPQILRGETCRVSVYNNSVVTYDTCMLDMVSELETRELVPIKKVHPGSKVVKASYNTYYYVHSCFVVVTTWPSAAVSCAGSTA